MQKFAALFLAIFFAALVSGCGGGGNSNATTVQSATKVALKDSDISGKRFYITPIDATSVVGYKVYQFNSTDNKVQLSSSPVTADEPTLDASATWNKPTIGTDGVLVLTSTDADGKIISTTSFTCIQQEPNYLLVYDDSNKLFRFYFNTTDTNGIIKTGLQSVVDFQTLITIPPPPPPLTTPPTPPLPPKNVVLGGTVQGTPLNSPKTVSTFAGTADITGLANDTGTAARFRQPTGITTDGTNLYVADYLNNEIRMITDKGVATLIAGSSSGLAGAADGNGTAATFNHPSDITTDGTNLYVVDSFNNSIRKITLDDNHTVTTIGSTSGLSGSVDSSKAADVRFNAPTGITTDGTNLYVTDSGNHTIRKIVISTNAVTTFAGTSGDSGSTEGDGKVAQFFSPARITTDGSNLYVTDFRNRTIRKIVIATREVSTITGTVGIPGSSDGTGTKATFNQPNGITTDGTNLYVTDSFNNTVRKIVILNGEVTTIIAGSSTTPGHVDTTDGTPSFDTPIGITTDGTSLFVADSFNHTIRKIE